MKPIGPPGANQPQSNAYNAHHHHHMGPSSLPPGTTILPTQASVGSLPMSESSFQSSDLPQSTQSNQLGSQHLPRTNYQQQGRVS